MAGVNIITKIFTQISSNPVLNLHLKKRRQSLIFVFFEDRTHIFQYCHELTAYFIFMNVCQSFNLVNKRMLTVVIICIKHFRKLYSYCGDTLGVEKERICRLWEFN